jgi:hypothetical protein
MLRPTKEMAPLSPPSLATLERRRSERMAQPDPRSKLQNLTYTTRAWRASGIETTRLVGTRFSLVGPMMLAGKPDGCYPRA